MKTGGEAEASGTGEAADARIRADLANAAIIRTKNGLSRSKYHIWDAQHDTSNLAASKAELTWMRLDLISLLLSLDLVTDSRLRTVVMCFFVAAFRCVAKRGIDIYIKKKKKLTPLFGALLHLTFKGLLKILILFK